METQKPIFKIGDKVISTIGIGKIIDISVGFWGVILYKVETLNGCSSTYATKSNLIKYED